MDINYDVFKKMLIEEFPKKLSERTGKEYEVQNRYVNKYNTQKDALVCIEKGSNIAPTLYIDDICKDFHNTEDLMKVIDVWVDKYISAMNRNPVTSPVLLDTIIEPEYIINNVYPYVVNAALNEDMLKETPHVLWNDLAVIFKVRIPEDASYILTSNILQRISSESFSLESLYEHAKMNVFAKRKLDNIRAVLEDCLKEMVPSEINEAYEALDEIDDPLSVLKTEPGFGGAGVIVCMGGVNQGINFSEDCYLLPSSINEFLVLTAKDVGNVEELYAMVYEINRTEVAYDEFLSDNVYYYNAQTREITMMESPLGKGNPMKESHPIF